MPWVSSTLSRIFKPLEGADEFESMVLPAAGTPPEPGVHAFELRRVGADPASGDGQVLRAADPDLSGVPGCGRDVQTLKKGREEQEPAEAEPGEPKVDLDEVRKQAFQAGYAEGEAAGEQRAAGRWKEAIDGFGRTVGDLATIKQRLRTEAEREVVNLALAVARRVIHREITVDPTTILAIVRTCLDELRGAEVHRLRVSGADLDTVIEYFEQHPAKNLEVIPDEAVGRGGAILETTRGRIDARIETQMQEIERGLSDG